MSGRTAELTLAADVWAFAITCVEILTMGKVPWPFMDDDAVRHFVLSKFIYLKSIFYLLTLFS
jgi:hypothetical protein